MDVSNFIQTYFIDPMYEKTGYNPVNTIVYSVIALAVVGVFYTVMKLRGKKIDKFFFISTIPFVVFGAVKRVITDAVDAGILGGGIYNAFKYSPLNISPGIYVFVGLLFLIIYSIEQILRLKGVTFVFGTVLALVVFVLLFPALRFPMHGVLPFTCFAIAFVGLFILIKNGSYAFAVASQFFDGCATFFAVDFLGYGEQHVIPNLIGNTFGFWVFPVVKLIVPLALVYLLDKEKEMDESLKWLIVTVVMIVGLAPGLRDTLRIMTMA